MAWKRRCSSVRLGGDVGLVVVVVVVVVLGSVGGFCGLEDDILYVDTNGFGCGMEYRGDATLGLDAVLVLLLLGSVTNGVCGLSNELRRVLLLIVFVGVCSGINTYGFFTGVVVAVVGRGVPYSI